MKRPVNGTPLAGSVDLEWPEAAMPSKKSPRRPWGWERAFWFHMPQSLRREHYRCCWLPLAAFNREDVEHGSKPNWWLAHA